MQVRNQVNFIFHQVAKSGNTRQVPQLFTCCWKDSSLLETCHSYSQKADRIYPCKNYKLKKAHTIHLKVACFLFIPPKHSKIETEVHYRTYTQISLSHYTHTHTLEVQSPNLILSEKKRCLSCQVLHLMWLYDVENWWIWFWLIRMTHPQPFCSHCQLINSRHVIPQHHPIFMK